MSETSIRRGRKTKLVPRALDAEDELSQEMQSPSKKVKNIQEGPAPIEFNVKIEVEEFCEDFDADAESNLVVDEGNSCSTDSFTIKTEVTDEIEGIKNKDDGDKEDDEQAADDGETCDGDYIKAPTSKRKAKDPKKIGAKKKSLLKKIYDLSQKSAVSVKQCKITDETVFGELEKLMQKDLSQADRMLVIETRNSWGRVAMVPHTFSHMDIQIQQVLNEWKEWCASGKHKGSPLLYICYICKTGWWHLNDLKGHLQRKHDMSEINCSMKTNLQECFLTVNSKSCPQDQTDDITVDSECWRCGNNFDFHKPPNYCDAVAYYRCSYCNLFQFHTCTTYNEHLSSCVEYIKFLKKTKPNSNALEFHRCLVCKMFLTMKKKLHKHYAKFHLVRSDLPMPTVVKTCSLCNIQYIEKIFHTCPRRNYSITCMHCMRRFPSRVMTELHKNSNKKNYRCKICNTVLRSQCMEMEHLVTHSDNFKALYKCVTCEENIFLMDDLSMKQHIVIWHKKFFDKRRKFVETVVVPRNCVMTSVVEQLDIVSSLSGKFEIEATPNSDGVLEVSQVEEIDFGKKRKPNKVTSESTTQNDASDNETECRIIENDNFVTIIDDDCSADDENQCTNDENQVTDKIIHKNINSEEFSDKSESNNTTTDFIPAISIKVEKDDEIQESVKEVKYIFDKVIKKQSNFNVKSTDNDDYANLLSKVFGGSHHVTTDVINIKQEPEDEEFFEDDIITLVRNAESEIKTEPVIKQEIEYSPEKEQPSTSKGKGLRKDKCKNCDTQGNRFECNKHRTKKSLLRKLSTSNCNDAYRCTKCDQDYQTIEDYAYHFVEHGYNNSCPACDRLLPKNTNFAMHLKMHVRYSFYKKQLLEKSVNEDNDLENTEGSIDLVYSCKECKANVDVELLFAHWEDHLTLERESTFNMDFNEEDLNTSLDPNLLKEIKEKLVSKKEPYRMGGYRLCCICSREFQRKNDHKRHLIEHLLSDAFSKHEDNNGLVCHFCGKTFVKPDHFREHLRDHASLPVFRCVICSKSFSDSSNFSKHRKTHNFHQHMCIICDKKFHSNVQLEKHMEMHEHTDPIKCESCDKTFFESTSYKKHMRTKHDRKQRFNCPICKLKFASLKDKWDHSWVAHKIRKQKADCPICPKSFRKYQDVKNHMKIDHNKKVSFLSKQLMKIVKSVEDEGAQVGKLGDEMYVVFEDDDGENEGGDVTA